MEEDHGYDPARGTAAGFAVAVVDSAAAMLCRYHRRFKRAADRPVQSLEESALDADGREVRYRELLRDADAGRRQGVTHGHGRDVQEWRLKPTRPDNHWLDCLVGCAAAASLCGVSLPGVAGPKRERKRYTQADLSRR